MHVLTVHMDRQFAYNESLVTLPPELISKEGIIYLPVPRHSTLEDLQGEMYRRLDQGVRTWASAVVLRLHPGYKCDKSDLERLFDRLGKKPVLAISWNDQGMRHELVSLFDGESFVNQLTGEKLERLLASVRTSELLSFLEIPRVALRETNEFHFEGPNGSHYRNFLRVGSVLQSLDTLDSFAFWLMPHLKNVDIVLLDSWTILSLGLNLLRYRTEAIQNSAAEPVILEHLRRYDQEPADILGGRDDLVGEQLRALLLLSVTSSGRLARRLQDGLKKVGVVATDTVSLYSSAGQALDGEEVFAVLPDDYSRSEVVECAACAKEQPFIRIEPHTYFMEINEVVTKTRINKQDAMGGCSFFERYAGLSVVSVHKDQHDGQRHHMIHIDVKKLCESAAFLERLERQLGDAKFSAEVIVCPQHDAAITLAHKISEILDGKPPVIECNEDKLGDLTLGQKELLSSAGCVLLVDDVVITGARTRAYRQVLVSMLNDSAVLRGVVGLARPQSFDHLKGIRNYFHKEGNFIAVEELLLPDWREGKCPWCKEFALYEQYGHVAKDSESIRDRYTMLQRRRQGLEGSLFLGSEILDGLPLGSGSIFGPGKLTQAELFCSVCNALQTLREKGELHYHGTALVAKILEPERSLIGRFYMMPILACILRGGQRCDLRASREDAGLREAIRELSSEDGFRGILKEFAFGMHLGKLPTIVGEDDILSKLDGGYRELFEAVRSRSI